MAKAAKPAKEAKKPADTAAEQDEVKEAKPAKKAKLAKSCKAIDVLDKSGAKLRTYSLEIHGEKFAELAEQFCAKHGATAKPIEGAAEAGEGEEEEDEAAE